MTNTVLEAISPLEVSVWRLTHIEQLEARHVGFDAGDYSRMKHGDLAATERLAVPLAIRLLEVVPELTAQAAQPVLPVAYKAVRPACFYLADFVLRHINRARAVFGLPSGKIVHIAKKSVTLTDYATASAATRTAELARIELQLQENLDGTQLLIIDDLRVTGAAERAILHTLASVQPARTVLAYIAVMVGDLGTDPSIEARLNHVAVTSVANMVDAVSRGEFALTIRFLKQLLGANAEERAAFISSCSNDLRREILTGAIATGPEFSVRYADALSEIAEFL